MSWKNRMYAGIGEELRSLGLDVITVTDLEEAIAYVVDRGGCDTCGHDYDVNFSLNIYYIDSHNNKMTYNYDGTFTDFIGGIT